jgi:hypothetical protein
MKRFFILMFGVFLMTPSLYSQTNPPWVEDFDGNVSFTATPSGSWIADSMYYLPGSSATNPRSYLGLVPNLPGDSVILITPVYDCSLYEYVILRFSHICKVSPLDIVRIEYRTVSGGGMGRWDSIPVDTYVGSAANFRTRGLFSAASYPEWQAGDSTVFPSQSWWKEEVFDLWRDAGFAQIQFRFVIRHGQKLGTQASYGWLIDNFQLLAANHKIYPPVVEFVSPFVKDTVYGTGPWTINAKVKDKSSVGIVRPYLKYTATENGTFVKSDSLLMDNVRGDSLWQATIPQFVAGTEVSYSITGIDSVGNEATAMSGYVIEKGTGGLFILQDGSPNPGAYPFVHGWGYSRSMSLYPAEEMEQKIAGQINTVSLRVSQAGNGAFPMKVWIKTVPASKTTWNTATDNLDWSVVTQDATLVYDDLFHFSSTGWFDIPLTNVFNYNGTDNLVVMFEQNCGSSSCSSSGHMSTYSQYYYSSTATNTFWYRYADVNPPVVGGNFSVSSSRPDLRINLIGSIDSNSVAIHSIDLNDTVIVSSGNTTPVVVTIKNKGSNHLTSADIYYSINGKAPQLYSLTGVNLPWDFNTQANIGGYTPTMNGADTVTVWVKMPNGVIDGTDYDDTSTKIIYSFSDIQAKLIYPVTDTVYTTGPHEIKAQIVSLTGAQLPPVLLYIESTYENVTTYDTLDMFLDMSDTLWKVSIPHYRFGSDVVYSIKLRDIKGNDIILSDSYYIKRVGCLTRGGIKGEDKVNSEHFYTGSVQTITLPRGTYILECWGAEGGGQAHPHPNGNAGTNVGIGGKGGYSAGTITIPKKTTVYVYVGGHGVGGYTGTLIPGGFNGGGSAMGSSTSEPGGSGGGASDIRIGTDSYYARVIVAGGGGGGGEDGSDNGGAGGGLSGTAGNVGLGATQTAPGNLGNGGGVGFGQGANVLFADGGGGGGGWYGGGRGSSNDANGTDMQGAGGGSGWIYTQANDNAGYTSSSYTGGTWLLNGTHYLTNAVTTDGTQIFLSPAGVNETGHAGNGYVRITPVIDTTINVDTLDCLDHSVELEAINSPNRSTVTEAVATPVHVTVRNRGVADLDSCYINWSLNGVVQPGTAVYRGKDIFEDFTDTITIGEYIPVMGRRDTVVVWVSMPNGEVDSFAYDDTLTVFPLGCPDITKSIRNIPGDFATLGNAIATIVDCGISGKVILEIEPINDTGTVDLSALKGILTARDTLVIRSSTGNAGDVVFTSRASTPALKINGIRNLCVEHITLNAAAGTHGVEIIGQCNNVEINGCIINANTTTTSSTGGCGVYYYGTSSGSTGMGNIRLLNNTINRGYAGIYFYYLYPTAAVQSASTSWVTVNGNTIENPYVYGIYSNYYARYDSIAYNTINTRASSTTQYGMYLYNYNRVRDGVIGNKINMRGTSDSYGIYPHYLNNSSTGAGGNQALVANNEIRKLSSGGTFYGLTNYYNVVTYIHNSVYAEGTGTNYAMYLTTTTSTYACTIMNNLFISAGTATANRALYCPTTSNTAGVVMDYNDYYSTGTGLSNLGATLPLLQAATQQNNHSVNIEPAFLNTANNLELMSNVGITAPFIGAVSNDIIGISRLSTTVMGAYELLPTKHDLMLLRLASWNNDIVKGQTVQVSVETQNLGVPITAATFGWSVNGVNKTPYSWTASPVFGSFAQRTIPIGSFVATGSDTFDVVVWIETINGQQDEENWNDTVSSITFIAPLAEFVEPFVGDTIGSLSFDVNVKIREGSGAPLNTPEMYIETLMDGSGSCYMHTRDTVTLIQEGDKWVAKIPKQYYNSTVIYETHVSDNIGNSIILKDTVYIMFNSIGRDVDYSYTGQVETITLPRGTYQIECWGADGGNSVGTYPQNGGKGGYSKGTYTLTSPKPLYIYVGGKGSNSTLALNTTASGGYNGGGYGNANTVSGKCSGAGGGGCTHVATSTGVLSSLITNQASVLIVAGGGGGAGESNYDNTNTQYNANGGNGGGTSGTQTVSTGYQGRHGKGGTQIAGGTGGDNGSAVATGTLQGTFGAGGYTTSTSDNTGVGGSGSGGGGAGYYGGGAGWPVNATTTSYNSGSGGGGSGYVGSLTDSVTDQFGGSSFVANPATNGDGFVRITTLSGGGGEVYAMSNNLAIFNLLSPTNDDAELCAELSSPVEIELSNLGENDYDFTRDNITIGYEIINPRGIIYNGSITIDTGEFFSGESMEIELMSAMPIVAGGYRVKAWVTSSIDQFVCDDTLNHIYTSGLIALPVDEDFSNMALFTDGFVSTPILGDQIWDSYTDPTSQILPPSGNGMLRYAGSYGSMAQLSTRQLDLSGVVDPELKFWYYHDATTPAADRSYTDVNIIVDGVRSTVLSLNRVGATTGWQQYTIDLKPFTNGTCVLIQFESMNKYDANSAQYIGHITITSTPDLAVSAIIVSPELNVCAMTGRELKVVLTTTVNQAIDLRGSGNNLAIHIGSQQPILFPLSRLIAGNTSDTVSVATNVDLTGITDIKAYLTSPVDNYSANDTTKILIDMRPGLEVKMQSSTGGTNCFLTGRLIYLEDIEVKNIGNVDLSGIKLKLLITAGDNHTETVIETKTIDLQVDSSILYRFENPYTVPQEDYRIQVTAWLECAPGLADAANFADECVDLHDLVLIDVVNPPAGSTGTIGSMDSITVSIENTDQLNSFESINITALIKDGNGQVLNTLSGSVSRVEPSESLTFTFSEKYSVPNLPLYFVHVYFDSQDYYPENDTVYDSRETSVGIHSTSVTNSFTLGQNIPNPATNSTRIDYAIPEAGEVIFHVHTISGQLLYSKTIEAERGTNTHE